MAKNDGDVPKLTSTEKLLVLLLIRQGLKQEHIASALGMHRTSLSRAFPKGALAQVARLPGKKQGFDDGQEAD
ncbi:helix-turn-helix domain-containing protein [Mesorhizobium sp. NPDC059025]|uniref:helix-turn-helix domain-containing protein n=1 Tax=unclassified Mesorhizobium TaxID=325217 RepID=UPI0036738875